MVVRIVKMVIVFYAVGNAKRVHRNCSVLKLSCFDIFILYFAYISDQKVPKLEKKIQLFIKKKFKIRKYQIHLSISDEKRYSIAYVILNESLK